MRAVATSFLVGALLGVLLGRWDANHPWMWWLRLEYAGHWWTHWMRARPAKCRFCRWRLESPVDRGS